ncbi:MAG TPA: sigma-70 family RNA polymerase sigma factor [Anaerolineales bacterium]|jgi:RNA polymerase sigma-70 factor (ECF subfamily)|nr:sigma-70 family RNA polymerase sigma factor [Anaerolineales bacterium]
MLKNLPGRNEDDESRLIDRAKNGDAEAFGELYDRHLQPVFRFFYSRLNNRQDAEDLTEETFFRVWRSLPRFEDQGVPFLAYIFHIARNLLIDHRRRSANSKDIVSLGEEMQIDSRANPSKAALDNIQHQEVKQALEKLNDDYQLVLVARFLSELSTEEVAQVLGRSSGAVRVLQHRALNALRKLVSP